jgi:hypothetical protein
MLICDVVSQMPGFVTLPINAITSLLSSYLVIGTKTKNDGIIYTFSNKTRLMSNNKDILFTSSLSIGYKTKNAVTTTQNLNLNLKKGN